MPRISFDYFFMSHVDESSSENPMLVMIDESTGDKYARAVGQKGLGGGSEDMQWLIRDLHEELKSWGHHGGEGGHVIFKSDNEPAIVEVREALARHHGGKVVTDRPPKLESQSNGTVEEAGKTIREFALIFKDVIESKTNMKIDGSMPIAPWMVRWAAMNISRYQVGTDGMTAFERRRGRKCNIPVLCFGEKVWYKKRDRPKDQQKSEPKWEKAIWLGHARDSNEMIVGTAEGASKTYAVKRMPEDERWDPEFIRSMQGIPQQPDPKKKGITIPISFRFESMTTEIETHPVKETKEPMARRRGITKIELDKYGFTPGCPGCIAKQRGEVAKRGHSKACRKR